jgi:hypothetical protein
MTTNLAKLVNLGFEPAGSWLLTSDGLELTLHTAIAQETNVLYAFAIDGLLAYVGKTTQSLKKRMQGYKSPASNGERGGSTNIKNHRNIIAALVAGHDVSIFAMRPQAPQQHGEFHVNLSAGLEDSLIRALSPPWNGRSHAVLPQDPSSVRPESPHVVQTKIGTTDQVVATKVANTSFLQGVAMIPSAETLFAYVRSHQGETFRTLRNKSPFTVEAVGNFLEITPNSSSAARRESFDSVSAVLTRLAKTRSVKMSDYKDLSFNVSYLMALVEYWGTPDSPAVGKSDSVAVSASKKGKAVSEDIAREQMAEYYKKNKAILPGAIREHRELIVQLIQKGLSAEQAFFHAQKED